MLTEQTKTQRPWERLGTPVTQRLTTKEALKITDNDWKVEKVSMMSAPEIVYIKDD